MATDLQLNGIVVNEVESDSKLAEISQQEILGSNQIFFTRDGVGDDNAVGLPIGAIFASAIPIVDARVHLLDGSTILQSGIYEEFAMLIKSLVASGQPISCSQSDFDTDVLNTGNCGKFVVDDTAGTIRLPKITAFIQGLSSITNIGDSLSAGLPNITGVLNNNWVGSASYSGAIYNIGTGSANRASTGSSNAYNMGFDASLSNSIYGNSNTVQPQATQFPYYIVLASGYKSKKSLDVDNIMNEVNKKTTLDEVYPVGSIYLTVNEHGSPAKIFGGTWEKIKDCFLWASGDTSSITYTENGTSVTKSLTVGSRGGEINHKLIESEIPSHTHSLTWCWEKTGNYYVTLTANGTASTTLYDTRSSGATGGNAVHNNMPPYLAVYAYKRIPDDE